MNKLHPINRTLLDILENQRVRTSCAIEDLTEAVFNASPGGDCKSIRDIGVHLIGLRQFQLSLLDSPLVQDEPDLQSVESLADLASKLDAATDRVERAVASHDPEDWYFVPETPRKGPWGEEPTIIRFVRPLNDFTNHLGSIRAIRRILGNPAERTQ